MLPATLMHKATEETISKLGPDNLPLIEDRIQSASNKGHFSVGIRGDEFKLTVRDIDYLRKLGYEAVTDYYEPGSGRTGMIPGIAIIKW